MVYGEDGGKLRPKIAIVREFLNCTGSMDMNPFMQPACAQTLKTVFADFANGVECAIQKLSDIAGADLPDLDNDTACEYLADAYVAESLIKQKPVDCILFDAFSRSSRAALVLQDLEREEKECGTYSAVKVEAAMEGLMALHTLAKTVPLVYEQLLHVPQRVPATA